MKKDSCVDSHCWIINVGGRPSKSILCLFLLTSRTLKSEMCVYLKSECGCGSNPARVVTPPLPCLHSDIKSKPPLPASESNSIFASKYDIAAGEALLNLPPFNCRNFIIYICEVRIHIFAVLILTVSRSPRSLGMRREDEMGANCKCGYWWQKMYFNIFLLVRKSAPLIALKLPL